MAKPQQTPEVEVIDSRTASEKAFDHIFEQGIRVRLAILHQALHVPGLGAERTINELKFPGLEMSWTPSGLLMKVKKKRVGVPVPNVANWDL